MIYLSLQTKRSVQEKKNKKGKNSTDLYQKKQIISSINESMFPLKIHA